MSSPLEEPTWQECHVYSRVREDLKLPTACANEPASRSSSNRTGDATAQLAAVLLSATNPRPVDPAKPQKQVINVRCLKIQNLEVITYVATDK